MVLFLKHILHLIGISILLVSCQHTSDKAATTVSSGAKKSIPLCTALTSIRRMGNLPVPTLRTGIGTNHLTITTSDTNAQLWFDQGLNHLHGFWHLEAYRAFTQVIKYDSSCAMGYWGIAMCQAGFSREDPLWQASIRKALALKESTTAFEKALIEASAILINKGIEAAQSPFRTLYQSFPQEPEALAFASIILRQQEDEHTQQEVKVLLEKGMKTFPTNIALLHYYIHIMELRPEFSKAKPVAEQMIRLAPNAPHLRHMPGHLYYLAGEYDRAITHYQVARQIEQNYHQLENIPLTANQNYIHNLQFIAVAQAEIDYASALKTAQSLADLSLKMETANEGALPLLEYEARILPALVHIRYRQFAPAIAHFDGLLNNQDNPVSSPLARLYFQAMRAYCKGFEALQKSTSNVQEAMQAGKTMTSLMAQFEQLAQGYQTSVEFKSINEVYDIMSMSRFELAGWLDNLDPTAPFNEAAWTEAFSLESAIKYDEPPRLMYPVAESLARLHKFRKDYARVEQARKLALAKRPKSKIILEI